MYSTTHDPELAAAALTVQRTLMVASGRGGHPDWMSSEGFDRVRAWFEQLRTAEADEALQRLDGVAQLRAIAMTRPESGNSLIAQMRLMLDNPFLLHQEMRTLLYPAADPTLMGRMQKAWALYRSGMRANEAAGAAKLDRSTFAEALAWLGCEQARRDRELDVAISAVTEGWRTGQLQLVLGCSNGQASKLMRRAKDVLAEL